MLLSVLMKDLGLKTSSLYDSGVLQVREFEIDEQRQATESSNGTALINTLAERKRTLEQWFTTAYGEVKLLLTRP